MIDRPANHQDVNSIVKFEPHKFYEKISKIERFVKLNSKGKKLIAQYYKDKYDANIVIPENSDIFDFIKNAKNYIENIRKSSGDDCRYAFIVDNQTSGIIGHTTPIIYFRENGEEGLLFADSLGSRFAKRSLMLNDLQDNTGIQVYHVVDQRQIDDFSCHADALIFGRDATGKDPVTKKFYIAHPLQKLKQDAADDGKLKIIFLPHKLLKTSQVVDFTHKHLSKADDDREHKNKPLTFFIDTHPSYIKEKSIKLAHIIEIQFYLNQLKDIVPSDQWSDSIKEDFIAKSKIEIMNNHTNKNALFAFTQHYLTTLSKQTELSTPSKTL